LTEGEKLKDDAKYVSNDVILEPALNPPISKNKSIEVKNPNVVDTQLSSMNVSSQKQEKIPSDSFEISSDMKNQNRSEYDVELEKNVRAWIEGNLGYRLKGDNLQQGLKDMIDLPELVNKLYPGAIKKISKSSLLPFKRDNFGNVCRFLTSIGVKDCELCTFEDIYEDKNMNQVLVTILAFARIVQNKSGYQGSYLEEPKKIVISKKSNIFEQ
jgi:hypothetical protein